MTSRNICFLIVLGFFLTFTFTGQLTDAQVTRKIKVWVSVTCDDESTKSLIQSWTKRELRNLGDVDIVGPVDAEVMITLHAREPTYQKTKNKTGGIAISYIFLHRVPGSTDTNPHFYFPTGGLATGNTNEDLEYFCKGIVADFDTEILEPFRIVSKLAEEGVKEYFQK